MPKFRPVSATTTAGVAVDATYLHGNGLKSAPWSGTLGRFGTVSGTLYTKGVGGPNVLLFIGDVGDAPCQNACASTAENIIRPMIATGTGATADADGPWNADTLALQQAGWSTEAIDENGFAGAVIFVTATQAPIAFYAGDPATTDVCAS